MSHEPAAAAADARGELAGQVDRLRLLAARLRDEGAEGPQAAELVEDAAAAASEASAVLERLARQAATDPPAARPNQDRLL